MKNYKESDYARNKYSEDIVYKSVDGNIIVVTLNDYIKQNPCKTEDDFRELKEISDSIYLEQVRAENVQTGKNIHFNGSVRVGDTRTQDEFLNEDIDVQEKSEKQKELLAISKRALDKLTTVQRRRYLLHTMGVSSVLTPKK